MPNGTGTLFPVFQNGTGSIDQGIGNVESGASVSTGPLNAPTCFTLTVTNAEGDAVTMAQTIETALGTFTLVPGKLSAPAASPALTLLPSGKVLITSPSAYDYGDLYDPLANTISPLVDFGNCTVSTLLPDGRVFLIRAKPVSTGPVAADVWDPQTNTHSPVALARYHASAVLLPDGKVLLSGEESGCQAELFDPVAMTAAPTTMAQITGASGVATLLVDGTVLLPTNNDRSERFDYRTGLFSLAGTFSPGLIRRSNPILLKTPPLAGAVLLAGGATTYTRTNFDAWNGNELFLPETGAVVMTGSWTGSLNSARMTATLALLPSGEALVAGGAQNYQPFSEWMMILADAELFNPQTGTFHMTGSLRHPRSGCGSVLLPNGKVLVAGGNQADLPN